MTAKELYEQDIVLWTARNAELLRAGRLEEADLEHIAEEIEDLGISQERILSNGLHVLLTHLLKMQAERQSRARQGWKASVATQRYHTRRLLKRAPSLKNVRFRQACIDGPAMADHSELAAKNVPSRVVPNSFRRTAVPRNGRWTDPPSWYNFPFRRSCETDANVAVPNAVRPDSP